MDGNTRWQGLSALLRLGGMECAIETCGGNLFEVGVILSKVVCKLLLQDLLGNELGYKRHVCELDGSEFVKE